jgi:hypothetical protein
MTDDATKTILTDLLSACERGRAATLIFTQPDAHKRTLEILELHDEILSLLAEATTELASKVLSPPWLPPRRTQ